MPLRKDSHDLKALRFGDLRGEFKLSGDDAERTIEGYGSVFGNVDSYGDAVAKGAFAQTLSEWKTVGKLPKMLLQHGGGMFGGSAEDMTPIGVWTDMHEDQKGLYCKGQLLDTTRGIDTWKAARAGALDGLSIGYITKKSTRGAKPEEPRRTLDQVHLLECSLVTFPANPKATISQVKGLDLDLLAKASRLCEVEEVLRDAGLSKKEALTLVSRVKALARSDSADPAGELAARMARVAASFRTKGH